MFPIHKLILSLTLIILSVISNAQNGYNIGEKVSNFSLNNVLNNAAVNLSEYHSSKAVVIIFTNSTCPFAKLYEDRIVNMAEEFKSKNVSLILINPSEENTGVIAKKTQEKNYTFPYLTDQKMQVSKLFGATKTPEAYILKPFNGNFTLVYKGAIDDNPQVATDVSRNYLKEAINDILSNQSVKFPERRPAGCMIANIPN